MIPSSELEMAINNTYASIVNEIQLSNLNYPDDSFHILHYIEKVCAERHQWPPCHAFSSPTFTTSTSTTADPPP